MAKARKWCLTRGCTGKAYKMAVRNGSTVGKKPKARGGFCKTCRSAVLCIKRLPGLVEAARHA